jgi:hypothetical protein
MPSGKQVSTGEQCALHRTALRGIALLKIYQIDFVIDVLTGDGTEPVDVYEFASCSLCIAIDCKHRGVRAAGRLRGRRDGAGSRCQRGFAGERPRQTRRAGCAKTAT